MIILTSKQRAYLKSLASNIETILIIGKGGITPELVKQAQEALTARELIKIKVLETASEEIKTLAYKIEQATDATLVQIIGSKFILYKKNKKNFKIFLPKK